MKIKDLKPGVMCRIGPDGSIESRIDNTVFGNPMEDPSNFKNKNSITNYIDSDTVFLVVEVRTVPDTDPVLLDVMILAPDTLGWLTFKKQNIKYLEMITAEKIRRSSL